METVYLDTHVVLWLAMSGSEKLSLNATETIERAAQLYLSPMVLLELQYLFEIKRSSALATDIVEHLSTAIDLRVCTHSWLRVTQQALRVSWTRDPFDRLITAHAALNSAVLITRDANIRAHYARALW